MKMPRLQAFLLIGGLVLVGIVSCEGEGPAEKAGKETEQAVEQAGEAILKGKEETGRVTEALTEPATTTLDQASKVEETLGEAAEKTAEIVKEASP